MRFQEHALQIGDCAYREGGGPVEGGYVPLLGEQYYCVRNYDRMDPFFMSIVSSSDHWLFISSTGGLTCGRRNADSALFPYDTDDKIAASSGETGHKAVLLVTKAGEGNTSCLGPSATGSGLGLGFATAPRRRRAARSPCQHTQVVTPNP